MKIVGKKIKYYICSKSRKINPKVRILFNNYNQALSSFNKYKILNNNKKLIELKKTSYLNFKNCDLSLVKQITKDKKLNISKSYLKPGFAFGGSCLPKDLQSLTAQSKQLGIGLPILEGTLASNNLHIEHAVSKILSYKPKSIGILGLGFKPNSDDVRESPSVHLIQKLKPVNIKIKFQRS